MSDTKKNLFEGWGFKDKQPENKNDEKHISNTEENESMNKEKMDNSGFIETDTIKRRGFFEAIKNKECNKYDLLVLLREFEEQAKAKIKNVDFKTEKKITILQNRIIQCQEKINELKIKLSALENKSYNTDLDFLKLENEKLQEEKKLTVLQQKLTEIRIKLGEAKNNIIQKSLEDAEKNIQKALNIQKTIYHESWALNVKKYNDEKDQLAILKKCFEDLYASYEERYKKINVQLTVMDVDSMSPITSKVLSSVATISFGAAGFFFSTFAGSAGFGNQDILYFLLGGIIDAANQPGNGWIKIAVLIGLILLVTGVSYLCNWLLEKVKKNSKEDVLSEVSILAEYTKKLKEIEYEANIKSNNWYAFWLQIIPIVLIIGLLILGIARTSNSTSINAINASSEGLIIGTFVAMSFAGLIYLYVVKIVDPRLLKWYNANPTTHINWIKANWEIAIIIIVFLLFAICIIFIPYELTNSGFNIIPLGQKTRYAILLFIALCLVGSISFAYSIRIKGLIQTSRFLNRFMVKLNELIAYCSGAVAPEIHNKLTEEHGNIVQHVLKQLSFNTIINKEQKFIKKKKFWSYIFQNKLEEDELISPESEMLITKVEIWEKVYFPHIVDELKAVEFEYKEQKQLTEKARELVEDYKAAKLVDMRRCENDIGDNYKKIIAYEAEIEESMEEQSLQKEQIQDQHNQVIVDLLDGFHLGVYYRENHIGPVNHYYDSCRAINIQEIKLLPPIK